MTTMRTRNDDESNDDGVVGFGVIQDVGRRPILDENLG